MTDKHRTIGLVEDSVELVELDELDTLLKCSCSSGDDNPY